VLPDRADARRAGHQGRYADNWYAVFAPPSTPASVIARLNSAFTAALTDPEVARKLSQRAPCRRRQRRKSSRTFLKSELDRWGKIIRRHQAA
jgi:tripartite-type tricarboxylate transporter receptor subunit TctC